MTTASVYRVFDDAGRLLYVGSSVNIDVRMGQHRAPSPWFPYMARWEAEPPMLLGAARRREQDVIDAEHPWFNGTRAHLSQVQRWRGPFMRRVWAGVDRDEARRITTEELGPCHDTDWRLGRYLSEVARERAGAVAP